MNRRLRRIVPVVAIVVVIAAVLDLVTEQLSGMAIPYALYLVVLLAIVFGHWIVGTVRPPAYKDLPIREDTDALGLGTLPDRPFIGVRRWEDLLELTRGDPEYFRRTVRPEVLALLDERARLTGKGTYSTEELGPRMSALLSNIESSNRPPSPHEMAAVVTELEELWKNRP